MGKTKLAIVGATGLVGQTFIHILSEKNDDSFDIKLFASKSSKNKRIKCCNKSYVIHELTENSFDDVEYACFFTSEDISKEYVPIALSKNVKVIDNSSAFRTDKQVPLVVFGVNENEIKNNQLVSNPNCCIIQSAIVLNTLKELEIEKVIYNTFQSVSGSGKQGIDDLLRCRKGMVPLLYETDISFTCIPKIGKITNNNFTEEENKLIFETKKIFNKNIKVLATCVRVPVMFSHGVSVQVKLKKDFELQDIKEKIKKSNNIVLCEKVMPSSVLSCKNDKVYVGRIRKDYNNLLFYCVADNIRVGAATNAYLILKYMLGEKQH